MALFVRRLHRRAGAGHRARRGRGAGARPPRRRSARASCWRSAGSSPTASPALAWFALILAGWLALARRRGRAPRSTGPRSREAHPAPARGAGGGGGRPARQSRALSAGRIGGFIDRIGDVSGLDRPTQLAGLPRARRSGSGPRATSASSAGEVSGALVATALGGLAVVAGARGAAGAAALTRCWPRSAPRWSSTSGPRVFVEHLRRGQGARGAWRRSSWSSRSGGLLAAARGGWAARLRVLGVAFALGARRLHLPGAARGARGLLRPRRGARAARRARSRATPSSSSGSTASPATGCGGR